MQLILCMGRARSGPGPCKGSVSYMYTYIYICYSILAYIILDYFYIILSHPILS